MRAEDIDNKIIENAEEIGNLAKSIETRLTLFEPLRETLPDIKQLIFTLRETTHLIVEHEFDSARNMPLIQTSDMMPCQMCNGHWDTPSEHVKGIRWEPVPGKGRVYICWECAVELYKTLSDQMKRLSHIFLFSLSEETQTQRDTLLKEIEEAR